MTREEKIKLLLDTGEYDFIKYIPKENMWKLIFALAYIEDTIPMSDIDGIKAEIKTEIRDYEGCADFNEGIRFGLRTALEIIDKHIAGKEREEAIKLLVNATYSDEWHRNEDLTTAHTAHNSAIKALEQEPCEDAISRQAVLEVTVKKNSIWNTITNSKGENLEEIISQLPPVNPQPCEDAISRESIKQKLQEHHDFFVNAYGEFSNLPQNDKSRVDEISNCIAMVVNESPITPQPRIGHWIHFASGDDCSECGWSTGRYISPSKYCPGCGCLMVEPQESEKKCKNCKYYINPDYARCHKCKAESEE